MKRLIVTSVAVACAFVFAFSANVDAAPVHGHASVAHGNVGVAHNHVAVAHHNVAASHSRALYVHGRSVNVSTFARGYRGWTSRCWFPNYGCYGYYGATGWYYWYAPYNEYLPISYMPMYPPTQGFAPGGMLPGAPMMPPTGIAPPTGATIIPGPVTDAP